jgi:hypothetical protein
MAAHSRADYVASAASGGGAPCTVLLQMLDLLDSASALSPPESEALAAAHHQHRYNLSAVAAGGKFVNAIPLLRLMGIDELLELIPADGAPPFGAILSKLIVIEGEEMGWVHMRSWLHVLFYALLAAPPGAFMDGTEDERLDARGDPIIDEPATAAAFLELKRALSCEAKDASKPSPSLHSATEATGLPPTPLLIYLRFDVTTVQATAHHSYNPLTFVLGNMRACVRNRRRAVGFLGLLPIFKNPYSTGSTDYNAYKRRAILAEHAAMDWIVEKLYPLRNGILWELFPGLFLNLIPRIGPRIADFPAQQRSLSLMCSARASAPCRFCTMRSGDRTRAFLGKARTPASVEMHARVDPTPPPRGTSSLVRSALKAAREGAQFDGVFAIRRPPWSLTRTARAVSSPVDAHLMGEIENLHVFAGVVKKLMGAIERVAGSHKAIDALKTAMDRLVSYRGPFSQCRHFGMSQFQAAHIESIRMNDMLVLIPLVIFELDAIPDAEKEVLTLACFEVHRLLACVSQKSFVETDLDAVDSAACAAVRALRDPLIAADFGEMIKTHHFLHYGECIRACGARLGLDVAHLERFHRYVKSIIYRVGSQGCREALMLQWHAKSELISLAVRIHRARSEELASSKKTSPSSSGGTASASFAVPPKVASSISAPPATASAVAPISSSVGATTGSLVGLLAAVADPGCRRTLFAASDMDAETSFLVGLGGVISASFLEGSRKVVAAGGVRAGSKTPVRDHLGAPVDLLRVCTPLQPGLSFLREVRGGELAFHSAALRLIANSVTRQIFPTSTAPTVSGLIAVTKLSSWSGKETLSRAYFDGLRLSLSGAAVLLDGSGMHVHDSLRIFAADDTRDDVGLRAEGPRIRAAEPRSSPITRRHSIVSLVALKNDAKAFVVGRIMQILSFSKAYLKSLSGGAVITARDAPRELYVLVELAVLDSDAAMRLKDTFPEASCFMEPYRMTDRVLLLPAEAIIRLEHVQPRSSDAENFWRLPSGGPRGIIAKVPLREVDEGASDEDGWWSAVDEEKEAAAPLPDEEAAAAVEEEEPIDSGEAIWTSDSSESESSDSSSGVEYNASTHADERALLGAWDQLRGLASSGARTEQKASTVAKIKRLLLSITDTLDDSDSPKKAAAWGVIAGKIRSILSSATSNEDVAKYKLLRPL